MSVGPMGTGIAASLSASQLAQNSSNEVAKNQQETSNQARQIDSAEQAEKASGVGDPDESEQASDRDADGRRVWERAQQNEDENQDEINQDKHQSKQAKDPSGQSGSSLDVTG